MSLAKSIVFLALVAFVAGAVKIKPLKQVKPAVLPEGISSRAGMQVTIIFPVAKYLAFVFLTSFSIHFI